MHKNASTGTQVPVDLKKEANRIRLRSLEMVHRAGTGHPGGDLSASDILATLYLKALNVDPGSPARPDRDRFLMSKGHSSAALYATLARAGFLADEDLDTYMSPGSKLNGHPDRNKIAGVEANTGPLGHGLPIAVGCALAAKLDGATWRTFVLTGDGELQEGSNWEAAMSAAHFQLDNLALIVDRNGLQQGARTEETVQLEPLDEKWRSFGWNVVGVDGHDHTALLDCFERIPSVKDKPTCIIARTVKGKGVSFIEDRAEWHHRVPTAGELRLARLELGRDNDNDAAL
jgi:transketolase